MQNLPKNYQLMQEKYPDLMSSLEKVGQAVKNAGPLTEKSAQLIQLAAAAAMRSEGAVHSHVRRALKAGLSPKEIRQALLLLVSTIGFPQVMAALSWADDVIDD